MSTVSQAVARSADAHALLVDRTRGWVGLVWRLMPRMRVDFQPIADDMI